MALLYLDIDHFKPVNDTHCHLVGDLLLQGFAGRLAKSVRTDDYIARLGGDEFTVVLENLEHGSDAGTVAGNIVQAMQTPFSLEDHSISISASVGVVLYRGTPIAPAKDLVDAADKMLYQAKNEGRNGYRLCHWPQQANDPLVPTYDTGKVPQGRFKPVGRLEATQDGDIFFVQARGPFNSEGILAVNTVRMEMVKRHASKRPYAFLTHCY